MVSGVKPIVLWLHCSYTYGEAENEGKGAEENSLSYGGQGRTLVASFPWRFFL